MGLRYCISRSHGATPYRVIFGKEPSLPSAVKAKSIDIEQALATQDEEAAEEYVEQLAEYLGDLHSLVAQRLTLYDSRTKRYYDEQRAEQEEYSFVPGVAVLLK